ncbi:MAG TPA: PD-(D/E)XK nuclease family protein [Planctomycetota bacterium]|nr:PD-(D/E)XK nuclease family protein [Planctomycetota bacterium]
MLHVAHGPFHPSLEAAFVARLRELRKDDPLAPIAVVAPSARLANRLKELALEAMPEGVAAVQFHHLVSFARLAAGAVPPIEDEFLLERLVGDLLAREFPKSVYLDHAAGSPKLARPLLDLLIELREGAVDPDDAYGALGENLLGEDDRLKLGEIFALLKAYETEIKRRGWSDRAEIVRRAAERAPEAAELATFKEIIYYGVVELVQVQIDLLRAVAGRYPTRLFYPWLRRPGYAFAEEFFVQVVLPLARTHEALDPGPDRSPQQDVIHASGARDEVWAAAKRILEWRAEGVPFDEMGIVARYVTPYAASIDTVFRDHRIPFSSSAQRPLEGDPYVSAAKSLLTLADDEFSRSSVMDLLASPHFRHQGKADPVLWDVLSRALGIGRGADEWRRRLPQGGAFTRKRGERGDELELEVSADQVDAFRKTLDLLIERATPPLDASWPAYAAWALALFRDFLLPGDAAPDVRDAFGRLVSLGRVAGAVSPADRRDMALRLLADLKRPLGSRSGVQVLDAMAARGIPFRRLIVLGLNERVFPRFILEDPFIRDAVRSRLATRLGPRLPSKLKGYDEERLLFTLLKESARERIVLSWQRSDDRGRTQVRSTFIEQDGTGVPRPPAERFASVAPTLLTRKEASILEALSGDAGRVTSALRAFGSDAEGFKRRAEFLAKIDSDRKPGPRDGRISSRIPERKLSPTALETFAACPFQYFSQRVLRLRPLDEPGEERETSPMDEGSLLHGCLEEFHSRLKGRLPATLAEARPEFDSALAAAFARLEAERSIRHPLVWEAEKAAIRRVLEAAVAWDLAHLDGFVPSRFEQGLDGEIQVGRVKLRVAGFADRIDLRPDGAFRIIDYKRSKSQKYGVKMETGVRRGRYWQPPLYFLLAEKFLKAEGLKVASDASKSGYLFLRELAEGADGEMWLEGGLGDAGPDFADRLGRSLASIERGEFVVKPGTQCTYCDYRTACRKQHTPTRLRAERFHQDEPE